MHDVVPVRGREGSQSNAGSTTHLGAHTENASEPDHRTPAFVLLYCLRADHEGEAETLFFSVHDLIERLTPEEVAVLRRDEFRPAPPESHKLGGTHAPAPFRPVLSGPEDAPAIRLHTASTE